MSRLIGVLKAARSRRLLGTSPVEEVLAHSRGFAHVAAAAIGLASDAPGRALDLGSGAGVPGLVLAALWPNRRLVLVDGSKVRCAFLREAAEHLGWEDRIEVVEARAEELGRQPSWREGLELVVARAFGAPAVMAECAAPLVSLGGLVIVSEPPPRPERAVGFDAGTERWPAPAIRELGLAVDPPSRAAGYGFRVLRKVSPCPDRYPRRVGIPAKRPLF